MRPEVQARLQQLIEGFRESGGVVNSTKVAQELVNEHPDWGLTVEQLSTHVARAATAGGVAIELDGAPPG
jgi:hypothetical protein